MVSTVTEETYDELQMLMREMMYDADDIRPRPSRINIASGEDLFNEHGESVYHATTA